MNNQDPAPLHPVQKGDRLRVKTFSCGDIPRSVVGLTVRVIDVSERGNVWFRRPGPNSPRYLCRASDLDRCLERIPESLAAAPEPPP